MTRTPPHRRDVGVALQNYALFPHLSVAAVRFLAITIAELIADRAVGRDAAIKAVRGCVDYEGAEAVQLGGLPFAGMVASIARETRLVVIDGVEASVDAFD